MDQHQQNSINMHQAVIFYFDETPAVWNAKTPLVNAFADFRNCADLLARAALLQQQGATGGYTKQKNMQKAALINLAHGMALKLKGYAKINNNAVLLQAVDYSPTDLRRSREQDLVNICQTIYDKGLEFAPVAPEYEITDDELTALQAAINVFKPMSILRDSMGDKRILARADIGILLKECMRLLDILDTLVEGLIKDKAFVAGYFQARKITDRAGRGKDEDGGDDDEAAEE